MNNIKTKITDSINRVEKWIEDHDYKGYEPFDGLSSFLRPFTFGNLFLERILLQAVRQSPFNLRPLIGIKPQESTKGRGYMVAGYLAMYKYTNNRIYMDKAVNCLEWLIQNKSPLYNKFSWGNHFGFASRGGSYGAHESIIVWTSLIGQAFLDAYEQLNKKKYLDIAISVCDWILALPREKTDSGICLSYLAKMQSSIHNSNMLGAAILVRTAKITGRKDCLEVAQSAMEYSCTRQLPDGAWYYGEDSSAHWIDNFHTGYNLDSLKCYIENTNDDTYIANLHKGFEYFKNNFFLQNGCPKYYHDRVYPIDSQCASQAIETLASFLNIDKSGLELAIKVANWTIDNMQDKKGFFYYRQYPLGIKAKTPMLHWAQATTYKALVCLLTRL